MTEEKKPSDFSRLMSYRKPKETTKVPKELKLHLGSLLIIFFIFIAVLIIVLTIVFT